MKVIISAINVLKNCYRANLSCNLFGKVGQEEAKNSDFFFLFFLFSPLPIEKFVAFRCA